MTDIKETIKDFPDITNLMLEIGNIQKQKGEEWRKNPSDFDSIDSKYKKEWDKKTDDLINKIMSYSNEDTKQTWNSMSKGEMLYVFYETFPELMGTIIPFRWLEL